LKYSFKTDDKNMGHVIRSLQNNNNLNDWEKGFVDNINNRFSGGAVLSENQMQTLSNIWEKY